MRMNTTKIITGILILIALAVFTDTLVKAVWLPSEDSEDLWPEKSFIPVEALASSKDSTGYPLRLEIPKLNINSKIKYVGLTPKGNMASPRSFSDVGWYKYGVRPGEQGSAVIAGHVNNGLSRPAVFWNLNELQKGDKQINTN